MKRTHTSGRVVWALGAAAIAGGLMTRYPQAHGTEARYVEFVQWKKEHIARAFGANRAFLDNVPNSNGGLAQMKIIGGKPCIVGHLLGLDVDDAFAFDIDETVTLKVTYVPSLTTPFVVGWDMNGGTGQGASMAIEPELGAPLRTTTVTLDRGRFAGQGTQASDIAIGSVNGIALCDIEVTRSNTTKVPASYGQVKLTVKDAKTGGTVPARIGIYDTTGRAPLASDKAIMLQRFADDLRMLAVNERTFWPSANRQAFYVDGTYDGKLPEGAYEIVATRGPEYRAFKGTFDVKKDGTTPVTVSLERYADLPGKGWLSGDGHIHVTRDEVGDSAIWAFSAAEDVYVGNLLEMGNIAKIHFKQPEAWGKASRFERDGHFVVSGQEDPRTGHLGHTIHTNLERPIRPESTNYFLYDKVFEESHRQGGISGFAHMGWGSNGQNMNYGLAMLAPFGLVDFIEVLQRGRFLSEAWYRLLNLGFRITPDAGSDWPYSDFPGIVRNYVKLDGPLNVDAWFASFKAGHNYVTNGPFLEFTVNGKQMGDEIKLKKGARLDIVAEAQLNPDIDKLDRLELVILGDVAASESAKGKDKVGLRKQMVADHSMWVAVRAYGDRHDDRNMTIAHSAPVYVVVDDEPTWKREAVPTLVAELRARLQQMMTATIEPMSGPEPWETRTLLAEQWMLQRPLLKPRVDEADALYKKLLDQSTKYGTGGQH